MRVRVVTGLRNEHGRIVTEPAVVIVLSGLAQEQQEALFRQVWFRSKKDPSNTRLGARRRRMVSKPTGRDRLAPSGMAASASSRRWPGEPSRSARRKARRGRPRGRG